MSRTSLALANKSSEFVVHSKLKDRVKIYQSKKIYNRVLNVNSALGEYSTGKSLFAGTVSV